MPRKVKASSSKASNPPKRQRKQEYDEDVELDEVDQFMAQRDHIAFNEPSSSRHNDVNENEGQAIFDIPEMEDDEGVEGEWTHDEEEEELPEGKRDFKRRADDMNGKQKGRFGKTDDMDLDLEEDDDSGTGSDEDEDGWGRQYYSKPSNRRAKEQKTGDYDEKREEERELEEEEVKKLQRKARSRFTAADDWGFDEKAIEAVGAVPEKTTEAEIAEAAPTPKTADPEGLMKHLQTHETLKLGLARDFPLIVEKLRKTTAGMKKLVEEKNSEGSLHKGLGWMHYQALLTYATTLAYYLHLCALPRDQRPDLSQHPIITRLVQLKAGTTMLEDLNFDAGEESGEDPLAEDDEDDEDTAEMKAAKRELISRMLEAHGGQPPRDLVGLNSDGSIEDDDLWQTVGLEEGELEGLLADADDFMEEDEEAVVEEVLPVKKSKKSKKRETHSVESQGETPSLKNVAYQTLEEPSFVKFTPKNKSQPNRRLSDDILGDPTELDDADAADKEHRKRSLKFHTAKIASTQARRAAARESREGGDNDIPYRDRKAARDAALRKSTNAAMADNDLDDFPKMAKKHDRDDSPDIDVDGDGERYYNLVKRRKDAQDEAKAAAQDQARQSARYDDGEHEGGPRALTRAIEKNRGLTPRRSKTGRNPRVKKRQAYEKAKRKVGSQRATFRGGQASLSGSYSGEKSGISSTIKSRRF